MKKILSVICAGMLLLSLAACKFDMDALSGTWTLAEVNGAALRVFAAAIGRETDAAAYNFVIAEEKITIQSAEGEREVKFEAAEGGFNIIREDGSTLFAAYSEESDTLKIIVDEFVYVLERGEYSFEDQQY